MVGDRYIVGVESEIINRLLCTAEASFDINNPALLELPVEAQPGLIELSEKEPAEESGLVPPPLTTKWMWG